MKYILQKLIAFHTVSSDLQSMHEGLDYIADFVAQRGMHVERFESGGHESLVASLTPGHKTPKVMLAAHLDVLHAPDELFELREADSRLYGRGTLDMKFAIAAYLQLIDELKDHLKDYDIGLMITTDEEVGGSDGTAKLLDEGYLPNVCILPDGGDDWQIQLHSKGFLFLRIGSHGKQAHGSRPWLGENAILPLMNAIHEIHALFPENQADTNTLNIGTISGGTAHNQVAHYAEARLDIRIMSEAEKQRLLTPIKAICKKHRLELQIVLNGAAGEFSLNNPYIKPFATAIKEVTGITVRGSRTLGSNDARYFAAKGIPCISFYPTGAGHHGPEEWIEEKAFYQFKEVVGRYLETVARTNKRDLLLTAIEGHPQPPVERLTKTT